MKVAQNDETNPNTLSVRLPCVPSIVNLQHFTSGSSVRKRETPGILSRIFDPFAGITYPYVRSPLAQCIAMSCFVLHLIALLFIVFPLRYFFAVDSETAAAVRVFDTIEADPSYLQEQPGKPPPLDHQISPILLYSACIRVV